MKKINLLSLFFICLMLCLFLGNFAYASVILAPSTIPAPQPTTTAKATTTKTTTTTKTATTATPEPKKPICTDDEKFSTFDPTSTDPDAPSAKGMITEIVEKIKIKVNGDPLGTTIEERQGIGEKLYKNIIQNTGFAGAVRAGIVLFMVIQAILFMGGMVEMKYHDFVIRLIKIGLLSALLSSSSWDYFNGTVVKFFNDGSDDIIRKVTENGLGFSAFGGDTKAQTFQALDVTIGKIISSKMFAILMATFTTGPYGVILGLMLMTSIFVFLKAILTAMWVYVMSLAMKALLFGLAPIFIACILFSNTRYLFDGWLNQVINASLQPILLFMFLIFFMKLMDASIDTLLVHDVCWTGMPEGWRGSAFDFFFWRFAEVDPKDADKIIPNNKEFNLSEKFPIDVMAILVFLILAEMSGRFTSVIIQICSQIANATTNLLAGGGPLQNAFQPSAGRGGSPQDIKSLNNFNRTQTKQKRQEQQESQPRKGVE